MGNCGALFISAGVDLSAVLIRTLLSPGVIVETPRCLGRTLKNLTSLSAVEKVVEQDPFDHGNRKAAVFYQVIVELAEPETFAGDLYNGRADS